MDSRVNCKEQAPKVTNHEFVGNEHTSYLSKMPAATVEQLTIAKILSKPDTDVNLRSYVAQLTKCSEDQAVTALYDCENDIERAVELVLDKFRCGAEEEWRTTVSKRAKAKHSQTSSPVSHEITRRTSNKKKAPSKLNAAASERQGESQNERDGGVVCNNSKQLPSERKPKNESEGTWNHLYNLFLVWDPYADLESDVHVDTVQNLTKDPEALDADALFATTARSKPPPRAFTGKLDVPLFIAPELLPSSHFSWKPTFGGDSPAPKFSPVAPTLPNSGRISNEADELLREPSDPRTPRVPVEQVDCSPKQYTFPQISQQSHTNDFELKNASLGVLLEPTKTEEKMGNITSEYSPHQYSEQMISEVSISYPINQKKQTPPMVTRTASDKPSYLEPSIKNYLLDSLPDGISKLNVGDVSGQNTKDQFPVQNNTQASLPSFPHGQSDQSIIPPQLNKVPVSHPNTHVSGHTQPMNANTQAAHLPPGMPHFISQFAPPAAYHMFNLPGGSNTAPAIFDLDHL
ncbi:unnamed protein product, partial [Trichobilharzia regenti]